MDNKASFHALINGPQPVLIDFFAEWCEPCKTMAPILKQIAQEMREQVKILKMDIDKNPAIAETWQIQGVPTLILFQKGQMRWRQSGVVSASFIKQAINKNIDMKNSTL